MWREIGLVEVFPFVDVVPSTFALIQTHSKKDNSGKYVKRILDERLKAENFDYVIIDTPPKIDSDLRPALRAADLVLVPVQQTAVPVANNSAPAAQ